MWHVGTSDIIWIFSTTHNTHNLIEILFLLVDALTVSMILKHQVVFLFHFWLLCPLVEYSHSISVFSFLF